jgi:hypothetical protein
LHTHCIRLEIVTNLYVETALRNRFMERGGVG